MNLKESYGKIILSVFTLISILVGIITTGLSFLYNYPVWLSQIKDVMGQTLHIPLMERMMFFIHMWPYTLLTVCLVIWIIFLPLWISRMSRATNQVQDNSRKKQDNNNELDKLIYIFENKIKLKDMNGAKKIYSEIKEKTKNKNYSREQYERIIELYKLID